MSRRKRVALFTLGLATCLAASTAAAVNQARNLTLPAAVVVNGVRLNPGEYTLIWDVTRSRTSVSFANDTQRLATVPARLVPGKKQYTRNTIVCGRDADGTYVLQEIHFTGPGRAIVFHTAKTRPPLGVQPSMTLDLMMRQQLEPPQYQPGAAYRLRLIP